MDILNMFKNTVKSINNIINELPLSVEEKTKLTNQLYVFIASVNLKMLQMQSKVITSKTGGVYTLKKIWRPITMLTFLILVILDSFGVLPNRLNEQVWTLLQLGLGGYIIGRSVEKCMDKFKR